MRLSPLWAFALASALLGASALTPAKDDGATDAVRRYVTALALPDPAAAFKLLTPAQQHYFRNARNFGSNYASTGYRVVSFSIEKTTTRNANLVQVDVSQMVSYFDIANERTTSARVHEAYFALRGSDGAWAVKELVVPWKSYAPHATGRAGGLVVIVDRVEFFSRRVQVDCTLRNLGTRAVQVLPLLRTTLHLSPGGEYAALSGADFPLNDRQFFEGARIYPNHQLVGYVNFAVPAKNDVDMTATLVVAPVIEDGAAAPASVSVDPIKLPKL